MLLTENAALVADANHGNIYGPNYVFGMLTVAGPISSGETGYNTSSAGSLSTTSVTTYYSSGGNLIPLSTSSTSSTTSAAAIKASSMAACVF
jgi:hypothetical protein